MRRRVVELVGARGRHMWVSTFHSACVRILRREADAHIRYRSGFSIYDDNDSRRLVEHSLEALGIDQKRFPARAVLGAISQAKAEMLDASDYATRAYTIYEQRIAEAFAEYERRLVAANAMDFDDLLSETVRLLRREPEVLERYQERFVHVLVDEYQDTNRAQYEIVAPARRGAPQRLRGRGLRPEHLPLPRRRDPQPLRLRARLPRRPPGRPRPELPLDADDPRRRQRRDRQQPRP